MEDFEPTDHEIWLLNNHLQRKNAGLLEEIERLRLLALDRKPISDHDLADGERAIFWLEGDIDDFHYISGRHFAPRYDRSKSLILDDNGNEYLAPEYQARYDAWRITHYARVQGPAA